MWMPKFSMRLKELFSVRLDEDLCEIILIAAKKTAKLDDSTKTKIGELLYDEWLAARVKEHAVTT